MTFAGVFMQENTTADVAIISGNSDSGMSE
jgi:hypothetical protein